MPDNSQKCQGMYDRQPCPNPAQWISDRTGNRFCDSHKRRIEEVNPPAEGGPTFRPIDQEGAPNAG